jgi:hypothetical protein
MHGRMAGREISSELLALIIRSLEYALEAVISITFSQGRENELGVGRPGDAGAARQQLKASF